MARPAGLRAGRLVQLRPAGHEGRLRGPDPARVPVARGGRHRADGPGGRVRGQGARRRQGDRAVRGHGHGRCPVDDRGRGRRGDAGRAGSVGQVHGDRHAARVRRRGRSSSARARRRHAPPRADPLLGGRDQGRAQGPGAAPRVRRVRDAPAPDAGIRKRAEREPVAPPRLPNPAPTPSRSLREVPSPTAMPYAVDRHDDRCHHARPPLAERALAQRVRAVRRPASAASSTSSRRWTTSSASGWGSRTSTRRARSSRRASRACARAGPTTRPTSARSSSAARSRRTSSGCYGVHYDPATEILITVGASEARGPRAPGDLRPGRRGDPPRAVLRGVRAGDRVRGRHRRPGRRRASRTTSPWTRRPSRRAITPRTKALLPGLPGQPDRRRPRRRRPGRAGAGSPGDHDLLVYSDEIYDRLAYGTYRHRAFSSLPGMRERTILMGGFSKAYAMTGWRVGWMCAPAPILEGIVKVHQYGIMSAPTVAQDAALVALQGGEPAVQAMVAEYDRRRRLLVDGLNAHRPADLRAARRVLRLPADQLHRPDLGRVHGAAAARGAGRRRPGQRVRAVGRGPRAHVLRDRLREARGGARAASSGSWSVTGTSRDRSPAGRRPPRAEVTFVPSRGSYGAQPCAIRGVPRIGRRPRGSMEVRHDPSARRPPRHRPGGPGGRVAPPVRLPGGAVQRPDREHLPGPQRRPLRARRALGRPGLRRLGERRHRRRRRS